MFPVSDKFFLIVLALGDVFDYFDESCNRTIRRKCWEGKDADIETAAVISDSLRLNLVRSSGRQGLYAGAMGANGLTFLKFPETFSANHFINRLIKKPTKADIGHDDFVIGID
jgi:hypothetical protein